METKNPYLERAHALCILIEQDPKNKDLRAEYEDIRAKSMQWTESVIKELGAATERLGELVKQTQSKAPNMQISERKQYQALIFLYRDTMALAKEISDIKKGLRRAK
jgi:hypothetical protein